jgi:2-C-methyl-D-erythritol 4-phosphate cytidylyltransferase
MGHYQLDMVNNTNKYYCPCMINMIVAHKLKSVARTNEHADMHIECNTVFFSLAFSYWLVGYYQLDMVNNTNKYYCPCMINMIVAYKLKSIARTNEHGDIHIECNTVFFSCVLLLVSGKLPTRHGEQYK